MMLSFFKRKGNKVEKQGSDSVIGSKELLGGTEGQTGDDQVINTEIYFTPDMQVAQEDRYYFSFLHNELPPLKPNQVALAGIELKQEGPDVHVLVFIRNSVANGIRFNQMPLSLVNENGDIIGQNVFDLSVLGHLPGNTSTPWLFVFGPSELKTTDIPKDGGWKLAFEMRPPHKLELAESWDQQLKPEDKETLRHLAEERLAPPNQGEINFAGIRAKVADNGELHTTLFIRNGNAFDINVQKVPLFVEDASGTVIAKGVFDLDNFSVKANSSKPWTFVFPAEMIEKDPIDLSKWRVYPPKPKEHI
jgi:accessory Sec system S-layer assembly protein